MPLPMHTDHTEARLVQRVRQGDPEALGALFDLHGESVYRLAYRLLGTREDAEDAVQDVFGGLTSALAQYDEHGAFGAWLRRVAARTALMRMRAERRREALAPRDVAELAANTASQGDIALRMTLDSALAALPDRLRAVFVLRMVEGYSHDEIARTLHISVSASKVRLHRAVQRLQQALRGSL
jgi:RNA polymerase sigma-70 factor (ECF subfamily)